MITLDLNQLSLEQNLQLNQIYQGLQYDIQKFIGQKLSTQIHAARMPWLCSSLASRNHFMSPFMMNIAYIKLCQHYIEAYSDTRIIVYSDELAQTLRKNYPNAIIVNKTNWKQRLRNYLLPIYDFAKMCYVFGLHFWHRNRKRKKYIQLQKDITIIETFFLTSTFKSGSYKDRYYGNIIQTLPDAQQKNIFLFPQILPLRNWQKQLQQASQSPEQFIYRHDFLTPLDFVWILFQLFVIRLKVEKILFQNIDITPLIKSEIYLKKFNHTSVSGLLNYRFIKQLKQQQISIKLFIDWYENQAIDKGFHKGCNDFLPDVPTLGYCGYVVDNQVNSYLTPSNFEQNATPKTLAVIGNKLVSKMQLFDKNIKVITAPAFRFQHLWQPMTQKPSVFLVALPFALPESTLILRYIIQLQSSMKISDTKFWIKLHPSMEHIDLKTLCQGEIPANFKRVSGNFYDYLASAKVLISNMSSVCMESVALGIPTIIIGNQSGLLQNPIPSEITQKIWRLCYTPKELKDTIDYFMNLSSKQQEELQEIGKQVRADYFEPVTPKATHKFLMLDN